MSRSIQSVRAASGNSWLAALALGAFVVTGAGCAVQSGDGSTAEASKEATGATSQALTGFASLGTGDSTHGPINGYPHQWAGLIIAGVTNGVPQCLDMVRQPNGDEWLEVKACPGSYPNDDVAHAPSSFKFYTIAGIYNGELVSRIVPLDYFYGWSNYSCIGAVQSNVNSGTPIGVRSCDDGYTLWKTDNMWGALRLVTGTAGGAEVLRQALGSDAYGSMVGTSLGAFGDSGTGPYTMANEVRNITNAPHWNNEQWNTSNPLEVRMSAYGCDHKSSAWNFYDNNSNPTLYAAARCPSSTIRTILSGHDGFDGGSRVNVWSYGYRASLAPTNYQVAGSTPYYTDPMPSTSVVVIFDPTDGTYGSVTSGNPSALRYDSSSQVGIANNDGTYRSGPGGGGTPCRYLNPVGESALQTYWNGNNRWTTPAWPGASKYCLAQ